MITLYGIPNCDTVRKARKWLEAEGIEYQFHDFKKQGVTEDALRDWISQAGLDTVLNRRGTTWRKLPESDREGIDEAKAIALLREHSSMIKRPVLQMKDGSIHLGFKPEMYAALFSA
jgi:Spx/MgsR family transcriptional regulator